MKKPNIFIYGPSGSGKSTALRNLDSNRTFILNCERKVLPFRNARLFERQRYIDNLNSFNTYFDKAIQTDDIDYIVIDSFTALSEMILIQAKKTKVGYDAYGWYGDEVFRVLLSSKNTDKYIIFTGVDELIITEEGISKNIIKVEGQRLKNTVEKEFVIVLYTFAAMNEKNQMEYYFLTNTNGRTNAKSPMDMLPYTMPNDLNEIIKLSETYYKGEENA